MTMQTRAPATRPVAVDMTREREYWAEAPRVLAILADLDTTRVERDTEREHVATALRLDDRRVVQVVEYRERAERAEAELARVTAPAPVPAADMAGATP